MWLKIDFFFNIILYYNIQSFKMVTIGNNAIHNPEYDHDFGDASLEEISRISMILDIIRLLRRNLPQEMYETCIRTLNKEIPLVMRQVELDLIPTDYRFIGRNQQ